jgi:hypothetical protein
MSSVAPMSTPTPTPTYTHELNVFYDSTSTTMTWEIDQHQENTPTTKEICVWSCEFLPIVTETKILSEGYELYSKAVELVYDTKKFNADKMYAFTKALRNNQSKSYAIINYNFEIQYDSALEILSIIQKDNYTSTVEITLSESQRCQFANQFDRAPIIVDEIRCN